jgi:hypothetical protein
MVQIPCIITDIGRIQYGFVSNKGEGLTFLFKFNIMLIKIMYFEQMATVIAGKYNLYYYAEGGELIEVPHTQALDLSIRDILSLMNRNILHYKKR